MSDPVSLGPYELTVPLGSGGRGEVHEARNTRLDRTVALSSGVSARAACWVTVADNRLEPSQPWVSGRLPRWARDLAAAAEPDAHRA